MKQPRLLGDSRANRRTSLHITIAGCAVIALSILALSGFGSRAMAVMGVPVTPAAQQATDPTRPPIVPIYITPSGFEPNEIHLAPGPHLFVVRNRTGVVDKDVQVKITLPDGVEVFVDPVAHTRDAIRPVDLAPGTYLVSVVEVPDRPEWQIRITVE